MNVCNPAARPLSCIGTPIRPAVINYRWPCLHRERRWLRKRVERLPADDLGACTRSHACMHALHTYAKRLSPAVDLCMHIKIDEHDTGRLVFFYFTQNLRACFLLSFFSPLIGLEGIFFSLSLFLLPLFSSVSRANPSQ